MADKTKIQWTDATWNPVRGCSRVSEGCRNCYAERDAMRMAGPGGAYEGLVQIVNGHSRWTGTVALAGSSLTRPLDWNRPRRIFVNSMSDLFHENLPDEAIDRVFAVMADCPRHVFQVLTKRSHRMEQYINNLSGYDVLRSQRIGAAAVDRWPLPNVWLGVSVEDQAAADERIPLLLKTQAAIRFVSIEPMLGPVDLNKRELICKTWRKGLTIGTYLDWVICGGESGPGARPMHPEWVRSLRYQCQADGVPFFFKQWGEWAPVGPLYGDDDTDEHVAAVDAAGDGSGRHAVLDLNGARWERDIAQPPPGTWVMKRIGKRTAGRVLDGRTWDEFPEVVECVR